MLWVKLRDLKQKPYQKCYFIAAFRFNKAKPTFFKVHIPLFGNWVFEIVKNQSFKPAAKTS